MHHHNHLNLKNKKITKTRSLGLCLHDGVNPRCCDKNPWQKQPMGRMSAPWKTGMAAEAWRGWWHWVCSQEAERWILMLGLCSPQPMDATTKVCVGLSSVKALCKHSHRHPEVYLLGDPKSSEGWWWTPTLVEHVGIDKALGSITSSTKIKNILAPNRET